jgi:dephospho-CoA kinase
MFKVGLTGGIASGKSTIGGHFERLGVSVYDTDDISHKLMQPGESAFLQTLEHFGEDLLDPDGALNRAGLREKVFQQPEEKLWLENMIHPMIREQSIKALEKEQTSAYAVLIVPLMFESGFDELVDYIIAIDCPVATQKSRLMQRDNIDEKLAYRMIQSQMNNEQRIQLSNSSVFNGNNGNLLDAIQALHLELCRLARQHRDSQQ